MVKRTKSMWRVIAGTACLAWVAMTAGPALAQVYRWVDERGVTHYGAQPAGQGAARVESKPAAGMGDPQRRNGPPLLPLPREAAADPATSPGRTADPPRQPMLGSPGYEKRLAARSEQGARDKAIQRCKDNRGARCDDAETVRQYMNEDKPLTDAERQCVMAARNTGGRCLLARDIPPRTR